MRGSSFFWFSLFFGFAFWHPLYMLSVLWCKISFSFLYNIVLLTNKKKKKNPSSPIKLIHQITLKNEKGKLKLPLKHNST